MSFWTIFVLLPSFTLLNDSKYSLVLQGELASYLDQLSLADALMNPQVVSLVLVFTLLYTAMALHMIVFGISDTMGTDFDFPAPNKYIDSYVASHTLMIRGLNPDLEPSVAEGKLRTLFGERFPKTNIIAVQVVGEGPKGETISDVA